MSSTHTATITLDTGVTALQSYGTTVAALIPGRGWLRTDRHFSRTTSKHANEWLRQHGHRDGSADVIPHDDLVALTSPIVSAR
jgi:hypothetical protein